MCLNSTGGVSAFCLFGVVCVVSCRWSCPTWAGRDTRSLLRWRRGRGWSQDRCRTSSGLTEGGQSPPAATNTNTGCYFYYVLSRFLHALHLIRLCSWSCLLSGRICLKKLTNSNEIWWFSHVPGKKESVFGVQSEFLTRSFKVLRQFPHQVQHLL